MHCNSCNSDVAARIRIGFDEKGNRWEYCDVCANVPAVSTHDDVYFKSNGAVQTDENLCDPKTGVPIPFSTKGEKAAIMKRLNIRQHESAERHHGARIEPITRKTYFT